mmetsp:Transcript_20969/g.65866  ORF Transcript_20969/g.65866 Transcript_20969/m.65866 type:complete len:252 (-) Transcript_20969:152-907(-)
MLILLLLLWIQEQHIPCPSNCTRSTSTPTPRRRRWVMISSLVRFRVTCRCSVLPRTNPHRLVTAAMLLKIRTVTCSHCSSNVDIDNVPHQEQADTQRRSELLIGLWLLRDLAMCCLRCSPMARWSPCLGAVSARSFLPSLLASLLFPPVGASRLAFSLAALPSCPLGSSRSVWPVRSSFGAPTGMRHGLRACTAHVWSDRRRCAKCVSADGFETGIRVLPSVDSPRSQQPATPLGMLLVKASGQPPPSECC